MIDNEFGVLVSTKNQSEYLNIVLYALRMQYPFGTRCQVVVCDDNSDAFHRQRNEEIVEEFALHMDVSYVFSTPHADLRWGKGKALNAGVKSLRGSVKYLIFLDGDCVPATKWLYEHMMFPKTMQQISGKTLPIFDPTVPGIVNFKYEFSENNGLINIGPRFFIDDKYIGHAKDCVLSGDLSSLYVYTFGNVLWCTVSCFGPGMARMQGCNFSVRRSDFEAVGGFKEGVDGHGSIDDSILYYDLNTLQHCLPIPIVNAPVYHFGSRFYPEWQVNGI